jgi:hypothetical protein
VGDVAAVRTGDEIQFSRIADPIWEGLERRSFPLAPGQPFVEGAYSLSVDATRAADTARIGEEEHEDDYEHAFLQTYAIVEAVVNRQAQRTCSFTASDSMLRFEPHTLDVQEAAHKRMLVQNVIGDLRRERPELVPPEIGAIADLADLVGTLEAHWARCLGALRGLSLLRDYNRSHRATAHVVVAALPRLAAAAGAVSSSTTGWHGSSTAAGVSPFHTRGGNSATAAPDTGSLLLQVLGPRMLLGHSERLIRFDSPYYQRSYAMDLTKTTPGVSTFSW